MNHGRENVATHNMYAGESVATRPSALHRLAIHVATQPPALHRLAIRLAIHLATRPAALQYHLAIHRASNMFMNNRSQLHHL